MYVDFFNYHDHRGEACTHCNAPLKARKRGRHVVSLNNYESDIQLIFHDHCYDKLKPTIHKFLKFSCSRCSCDIDMQDKSTYLPSRIYYDNAHDDDVTCTSCMLSDLASAIEIEVYELNKQVVRGTKRLLDDGGIDDPPAAKKMKHMNNHAAAMSCLLATTYDHRGRLHMIDQIYEHASHYKTYMLCVHKKHLMDKCMQELMQKVWDPKNFHRWRHLIDDDECV